MEKSVRGEETAQTALTLLQLFQNSFEAPTEKEISLDDRINTAIYTLSNGDKYQGELFKGEMWGQGTLFYKNGDKYVGEFVHGKRHGRGIFTSDGGVTSELVFQNDFPIGNMSHLGDSLFLQLLSQQFKSRATQTYCLGIMSDYLIKMRYNSVGYALKEAEDAFFRSSPIKMQIKAKEIFDRLHIPNQPVLLSIRGANHIMGLRMRQATLGFVDFEIYNSGKGLRQFHKQHAEKMHKFQTVWKRRVPLANLTLDQLKLFLERFPLAYDPYHAIRRLPGSQEIAEGEESVIWQKEQLGKNCALMWIFVYLKNNMTPQEYTNMCMQLFTKCLDLAKQAEEPNQKLIGSLQAKVDKFIKKNVPLLSVQRGQSLLSTTVKKRPRSPKT